MKVAEQRNDGVYDEIRQLIRQLEVQHRYLVEELEEILLQARQLRDDVRMVNANGLKQFARRVEVFTGQIDEHFLAEEEQVMPVLLDYERANDIFAPTVHFSNLVMESRGREARKELLAFVELIDALKGEVQAYWASRVLDRLLDGLTSMTSCLIMEHKYILPPAERMVTGHVEEEKH